MQPPREEFTDIRIHEDGTWFTNTLRIHNKQILKYFKKSLHRDHKGIYILNTFGSLQEKGYIKVNGPLLFVDQIINNHFILENDEFISFEQANIIIDENMIPYLKINSLNTYAGFNKNLVEKISSLIEIQNDNFLFMGKEIPQIKNINWS